VLACVGVVRDEFESSAYQSDNALVQESRKNPLNLLNLLNPLNATLLLSARTCENQPERL
jgi:hypothetical protein